MVDEKAFLLLDPKNELHFKGPTTSILTCHLKLTNPTDRRICFKVKTTAPKRYCVRPNNGVIGRHSHTIISVMLQPFDAESSNEKSKHKFMVQTAFAPDDAASDFDLDSFWKNTPSSAISDAKLRVVFEQETSSTLDFVSDVSNSASAGQETVINSTISSSSQVVNKGDNSPLPPASLPSSSISSAAMDTSISSNTSNSSHQPQSQPLQQQQLSQLQQQQSQSGRSHQSAHSNESGEEINKLRHELKRLKQENLQLKEDGLRQRYRASSGQSNETSTSSELLQAQAKLSGRSDMIASQDLTALMVNPNVIALVVVAFVIGMVISKIVF